MKIRNSRINNLVQVDLKSRRMFLKSAGGLSLAIPFLPSLLLSEKAMAATNQPLRYVQIFTPHGGLRNVNWAGSRFPTTNYALAGYTGRIDPLTSFTSSNGLSPVFGSSFNNLFSSMNLIMGVDQPAYFGHNRVVGTGAFAANHSGSAWASDQFSLDSSLLEMPSIDQIMGYAGGNGIYNANLNSSQKRFLNIKAGSGMGETCSYGRSNYNDLSQYVMSCDRQNSTAGIFSYLFGGVKPSTTTVSQSSNPLLNLVNEFWPSGKSLLSQLSAQDRSLLDQLFSMAQDASRNYSGTSTSPACSTTSPGNLADQNNWGSTGAGLATMADIIGMAFKCDITRVVSILVADGICSQNWHDLTHNSNSDGNQAELIKIHKMVADNLVARLGNNINVTDSMDSSSTILKNSLISWVHENKTAHDNINTPTLLLGQAGGRIQTNQFADITDKNSKIGWYGNYLDSCGDMQFQGDMINRLWTSIFYAMGINKSQYEIQRGGSAKTLSLNKGYGHIFDPNANSGFKMGRQYNFAKIGDPWEFLTKSTTSWG